MRLILKVFLNVFINKDEYIILDRNNTVDIVTMQEAMLKYGNTTIKDVSFSDYASLYRQMLYINIE